MTQLEILIDGAYQEGINVVEKDFKSKAKGLCKGNKIAIRKDILTFKEKSCVLAEELGHYFTSVGDIIDQSNTNNRKQEYRARLWAYDKQVGLFGIVQAYEAGCHNLYDMAEYLNVTEEFLMETLSCYKGKYGLYTKVDNYIIYFEPYLGVMKLL